jgi:putative PIN family toxin of toxin-antitoxin system
VRVVFDTNIFVSAFAIPGGMAEIAYRHAVHGAFELVTSVAVLTETANILKSKFDWSDEKVKQLLKSISKVARVLKTQSHINKILEDEPDNRILECAFDAEADKIVTGDNHLLSLKRYQDISIATLADFLQLLKDENH